jgi:glycosyltransferase involved in cell wall biosynthesis
MTAKQPKPHVSVVIPTLNEEPNMSELLQGIEKQLSGQDYEIIVVDGGSKDKTVAIAKKFGAKIFYDNNGKGAALIKGLHAATGEILVSMDADLSHRPDEMKLLIDGIEIGYDLCMGSRFIAGGGTDDMPLIRVLGNKFFVWMVNVFFGSNYSDLCYGYRSFRQGALHKMRLEERGFGIETEISIKAMKARLRIMEVPSREKKRVAGEAKLRTFHDGYIILKTLFGNIGS